MLPVPTPTAIAAFAGLVGAAMVGIGSSSVVATVIGTAGLAAMATALAATMPLGRLLRRQRLEFAWWLDHASTTGGAVVPGVTFEVRCYVRHRGPQRLVASWVRPVAPPEAEWCDPDAHTIHLVPRARSEFSFRFEAPATGRLVLQGLAMSVRGPLGLFDVPLYFPNPLAIRVLPRAARRPRGREAPVTGLPMERSGRTSLRRRGGGTELYELRELVPGDPFNAIAWKASARAGRLMVKEVEHEVQETRWILVDVSGTMRGGALGARKLDFALETAAAEAKRAIQDGDRVGLVTFDGRILAQVPPGDGSTHLPRIYDALLSATEVVDPDLTEVDDAQVATIVGRYVRQQDGLDFSSRDGWDVPQLVKHVTTVMRREASQTGARPSDPKLSPLRRFCLLRGIHLPYRPDPRDGSKGPALAEALRVAGGSPAHILIISDLDAVTSLDPVVSTLRMLRAHGAQLGLLLPDGPSFSPPPADDIEHGLHRVYLRAERRRQLEAQTTLGQLGVRVRIARPMEAPKPEPGGASRPRRAA